MRAVAILTIVAGVLAISLGAVAVFYWIAALLGVVTAALFHGAAYLGVALANALTLLLGLVMIIASMLTLAERKWSALMQDRIGPNRARIGLPGLKNLSMAGLPHFLADGIKMISKEDFSPPSASTILYTLGPVLAFAPVFCLFAIVPLAPPVAAYNIWGIPWVAGLLGVNHPDFPVALQVAPNLDVGLLFVFALASLAVYGTSLAGWSSNNRLALLGGVRASSQMIAYEVALGLSLVGAMMAFGSLRLEAMTSAQMTPLFGGLLPAWGIFLQPLGFLLFFAAAFAETKRAPFDTPEGESEIIGYFIEYSGMRFGLFMISEFVEIVVLSGIIVAVFLGGYHLPVPPGLGWEQSIQAAIGPFGLALILGLCFMMKLGLLCWVQLLIRWTMPRFRYDQIQTLGWKILLPIALLNVFVTGVLILFDPSLQLLAAVGLVEIALLVGVTLLYPAAKPRSVRRQGRAGLAPAAPSPTASGH